MPFRLMLCCLFVGASLARAWAQPAPSTILVMPMDARQGVSADSAELATSLIVDQLRRTTPHKVLSFRELEGALAVEVRRMVHGCDEASCAAEIGGALNAEQVVLGSVGRLGSSLVLSLSRIRQRDASLLGSFAQQFDAATDAQLGQVIPKAVEVLMATPVAAAPPPAARAHPAPPPASAPQKIEVTVVAPPPPQPAAPPAAQDPVMRVASSGLRAGGGVVGGLGAIGALGGLVGLGAGTLLVGWYVYQWQVVGIPPNQVQGVVVAAQAGTLAVMAGLVLGVVGLVLMILGTLGVASGVMLER